MRSDGHEFLTDITLARMVGPKGVYNLALARFSPRTLDVDVAAHSTVEAEPDQNAPPDIDEPDAGR